MLVKDEFHLATQITRELSSIVLITHNHHTNSYAVICQGNNTLIEGAILNSGQATTNVGEFILKNALHALERFTVFDVHINRCIRRLFGHVGNVAYLTVADNNHVARSIIDLSGSNTNLHNGTVESTYLDNITYSEFPFEDNE